jgi:hypothetical protein
MSIQWRSSEESGKRARRSVRVLRSLDVTISAPAGYLARFWLGSGEHSPAYRARQDYRGEEGRRKQIVLSGLIDHA